MSASAPLSALNPEVPSMDNREFDVLRTFIGRIAGIHLTAPKRLLLIARLTPRLRARGFTSFREYIDCALADEAEQTALLDAVTTNETSFFREPQHFELLERELLPAWREEGRRGERARRIRVWSAACASGEEPYSIAMCLLAQLPPDEGWTHEIIASDLSTRVLERAEQATWPIARSAEIPPRHLKAFMLRGTGEQAGKMRAGPAIRSVVRFLRVNLVAPSYPVGGGFDLVFCRNVLIYFAQDLKAIVVERLLSRMSPRGRLFLGHSEGLAGLSDSVRQVIPNVYAHRRRAEVP